MVVRIIALINSVNLHIQDVIVHVNDASHPDRKAQMDHVEATIKDLITDQPIINVANKIDLVKNGGEIPTDMICVSATKFTGKLSFQLKEKQEKFYFMITFE